MIMMITIVIIRTIMMIHISLLNILKRTWEFAVELSDFKYFGSERHEVVLKERSN